VIGKFSEAEFREKISAGEIWRDHLYLPEGEHVWREATEYPGAVFPPKLKPANDAKTKKQMTPLQIGVCCALIGMFAPLVNPILFFLASLPLLTAAFVLAIMSIVRGKIAGGILLLMGIFFAFPMSCVAMIDRQEILQRSSSRR
jgi:hypothetical protein